MNLGSILTLDPYPSLGSWGTLTTGLRCRLTLIVLLYLPTLWTTPPRAQQLSQ